MNAQSLAQTFSPDALLLVRSLGWALLHSLWQGALISLVTWVLLKNLPAAQARLKYHLQLAALLITSAWFVLTMSQQWVRLQSVVVTITESATDVLVTQRHAVHAFPASGVAERWLTGLLPEADLLFPWLVGLYVTGLLLMLVRLGAGVRQLYTLRRRSLSEAPVVVRQLLESLQLRLQIAGQVTIWLSHRVQVPMVLGILRPVILLPAVMATGLTTAQLEAILLHELAHVKRQDYLINILQTVVETILFFNPFVWWISAGIRREREYCCDDLVMAEMQEPLPYASALATLAAHRFAAHSLALAASGSNQHHLLNRIKRFTEMKKTPLNYGRLFAAIVTTGLIAGAVIWFTPALAQKKKSSAASSTTRVQKIIVIDDQGNKKEYDRLEDLPGNTQSAPSGSIDDAGKTLREQLAGLEHLNDLDSNMSGAEMRALVNKALKSVDWSAIGKATGQALEQAASELDEVDWKAINRSVDEAMREVDWDVVADAAKAGPSGTAMRLELRQKMKEANAAMQAAHAAAADAHRRMEDMPAPPPPPAPYKGAMPAMPPMPAMPHMPAMPPMPSMPAAGPANDYNQMFAEMDRDGLIDQDRGFEIDKNSRDLIINGEAQPDAVKVKYRHYFSPGKVHIQGNRHSLQISATQSR